MSVLALCSLMKLDGIVKGLMDADYTVLILFIDSPVQQTLRLG